MKIAVEGCAHGELEKIYACVEELQARQGVALDLLICCGDFQAVRNTRDLRCMAVPDKYQNICTFYKYYSGEKRAPVLTLFIGGNHEASNYLQELPYGGWVAPNIYYLGRAGVVKFGDVRIGGMSGIFKGRDYLQGFWESPPYNAGSMRSVYHVRALDVFRLRQLKEEMHVMLSHDWPTGITNYGNKEQLLSRKPYFREDIESNQLGSKPAEELLRTLKPTYWFSAHLHCQFVAVVPHENGPVAKETKFLALDKCLPRRRHLQIVDIPHLDGDKKLKHDPEWLAILKNTNHLMTVRNMDCHMPGPGGNERYEFTPTDQEKNEVIQLLGAKMEIVEDSFVKTASVYVPGSPKGQQPQPAANPQTVYLCEALGIDDPLAVLLARTGRTFIVANQDPATSPSVSIAPVSVHSTPVRKMSLQLPTPLTPIVIDSEPDSFSIDTTAVTTDDDSTVRIDSSVDCSLAECTTPEVVSSKKTFKRRNQSLYTPNAESEETSTESSTLNESDTPKSTKMPFRRNQQIHSDNTDIS